MMSLTLKKSASLINVENDCFINTKDQTLANDIYDKYNLQSVLETTSDFMKDDKPLPGYDKYISVIRALVHNASNDWIRDFIIGFNDQSTSSICVTSLKSLAKFAEVAPFPGEEREFLADDFKDVPYRGYLILSCFERLFERLTKFPCREESIKCSANLSYFCVVFIALHHDANLWTNGHTNTLSALLLTSLIKYWKFQSISELLVMDLQQENEDQVSKKSSIFGKLLLQWKPQLLRRTWKQNPTVAASFWWCLKGLKFPHTSEFIEVMLPPSLLFVDDYMTPNKEMGVCCLISIMETAGVEELRWYGRADVIYEALKLQMYRTEETLLRLNLKALLLVLNVVEKNPDELSSRTRYDEVLSMMLQNASHENKLALRRVHTEYLHTFIDCLGINSVKYLKNIIDLTEEYLEISDSPEEVARVNILRALNSLIKVAWPRIKPYMTNIIKILFKVLYQINLQDNCLDSSVKEKLTLLMRVSFSLLKAIDSDLVVESLSSLRKLPFPNECLEVINSLMDTQFELQEAENVMQN